MANTLVTTDFRHSNSRQFINLIALEKQNVGESLQSCTSEISVVEARIGGKRVVVIDTPGIDDTRAGVKEADVLLSIANLLDTM